MPRFVFVDTEATGLDHTRHELTEVSWILRREDGTEVTRQYFPEHTLDGAEPAALELTNYAAAIAPQPRTPATVWLRRFLEDAAGAYLVGAVPDFDATHLARMCRKMGWAPTWDHHLLDVETLALPLIAGEPEGPRSLARTARALGVVHDDRQAHGALYDAQQAMAVFDAVWDTLASLRAADLPLPEPVPRHHNGRPLPTVEVVDVTDDNWQAIADVSPRGAQHAFVHSVAARYMVLAQHSAWTSVGLVNEGTVVGHAMRGVEDDCAWIGGFMIDARHQSRGIGLAAVRAVLDSLTRDMGEVEVRVTIHPNNDRGQRLWRAHGFEPSAEMDDDERVWIRPAGPAPADQAPADQAAATQTPPARTSPARTPGN